jgi:hypothetical protein
MLLLPMPARVVFRNAAGGDRGGSLRLHCGNNEDRAGKQRQPEENPVTPASQRHPSSLGAGEGRAELWSSPESIVRG